MNKYQAIVIGTSAGGFSTLPIIVSRFDKNFPVPLILVQHTQADNDFNTYIEHIKKTCTINIKVADEKEKILTSTPIRSPGELSSSY